MNTKLNHRLCFLAERLVKGDELRVGVLDSFLYVSSKLPAHSIILAIDIMTAVTILLVFQTAQANGLL
jgi:hypothetical protein